jgi:ankyrin repeat protein
LCDILTYEINYELKGIVIVYGQTSWHIAVANNDSASLTILLDRVTPSLLSSSLLLMDHSGYTPYHRAHQHSYTVIAERIAKYASCSLLCVLL